ncbi:MAG: hypothetical protein IE926_08185 [Micrococcales bacterium]|nr:hypothetical protein [Micrococcales bacterium]
MGRPGDRTERLAALAAGLSVVVAGALLAAGLALSPRGLDLLDGAYQLRLVASPGASRDAGEAYLFGFLLHPLYELVGEGVAVLRTVAVLLLAGAAALAARDLVRMAARGSRLAASSTWAVAAAAAASTLLVRTLWTRDPGYRWVALLGLVFVASGLARAEDGRDRSAGVLLGLGLVVAGTGRPTTGAAAGLLVLVVVALRRWWRPRFLGWTGAVVVGAAAGVLALAGMTPRQAVQYHVSGLRMVELLGDHGSVLQLAGFTVPDVSGLLLLGTPLLLVVLPPLVLRRAVGSAVTGAAGSSGAAGAVSALVVLVLGGVLAAFASHLVGAGGQVHRALSVALVLPLLATVALLAQRGRASGRAVVLVAVLLLPYPYALGSNVAFSLVTAQAACLWVAALGALAVLPARTGPTLLSPAVAAAVGCAVTGIVLWTAWSAGPPESALAGATVPAPVASGTLLLPADEAAVATRLHGLADEEGISADTPVVDLTGVGAGYAFELGGHPLGRAHLYGTWAGGVESARYALDRVPCREHAAAYLLYAPDNPSDVSAAFTRGRLDLHRDYTAVDRFPSRQFGRTVEISVLRPGPTVASRLGCPASP